MVVVVVVNGLAGDLAEVADRSLAKKTMRGDVKKWPCSLTFVNTREELGKNGRGVYDVEPTQGQWNLSSVLQSTSKSCLTGEIVRNDKRKQRVIVCWTTMTIWYDVRRTAVGDGGGGSWFLWWTRKIVHQMAVATCNPARLYNGGFRRKGRGAK